jgi:hypothetical protein
MQVSATLIAAQQAAREARARLAMPQAPAPASQPAFAAALEKTAGPQAGFSSLPLKQVAPPQPAAPAQAGAPARMGQHIDITV